MVRQAERREKTQRKILEAAARVLVEHGYAATSTTRILEEAGVSRGAMLHHFPQKTHLMQAVLRHVLQVREHAFQAALARRQDDEDPVDAVMDAFWEAVGPEEAFAPWLELIVAARTDPELRKIVVQAADDIEQVVMKNFQRVFDVAEQPDLVVLLSTVGISILQGLAMRNLVQPSQTRTEGVLAVVKLMAKDQLTKYVRSA